MAWLQSPVTACYLAALKAEYDRLADDRARVAFRDPESDQKTIHNLHESIGSSTALLWAAKDPIVVLKGKDFILEEDEGEDDDGES